MRIDQTKVRKEKGSQFIEPYHAGVTVKNYPDKDKLSYRDIKNAGHYSFKTLLPKSIRSRFGVVGENSKEFDQDDHIN